MITKEIAINSHYRQEFYHVTLKGSDKMPVRCRVNGKCKIWKTEPSRFSLPVKHGLKQCFYITEKNCADWETIESFHDKMKRQGIDEQNGII